MEGDRSFKRYFSVSPSGSQARKIPLGHADVARPRLLLTRGAGGSRCSLPLCAEARHGAAMRGMDRRLRRREDAVAGMFWGVGLMTAGFRLLAGDDFNWDCTGAKGQMTPLRRAPCL
jgi:hypothetical protein